MKKSKIIILASVGFILLVAFLVAFYIHNIEKDLSEKLTKTKTVVVAKLFDSDDVSEKKITDSSDIDELVKIIQDRKEMPEDEDINYRGLPNYRLKFLDKKDSVIAEVNFYYSGELSWISIKEDEYYKIDSKGLLEILNELYDE